MIRGVQNASNQSKQEKTDSVAKYFSEQKILIKSETQKLQSKIDSLYLKLQQNNLKLEKLSKQKSQIKYVYIKDLQKIDALDNNGIVKEFDSFFSKSYSGQ
jgi:predicted RNase H-like nuclease (RuvC/YqgF family)